MRLVLFTALALVGFAANSLLCRAALRDGAIGAAAFTTLRLVSGALVLALLVALRERSLRAPARAGSWRGAGFLLAYAWAFAAAYHGLTAGMGALLLFAAVQVALFGLALREGRRPRVLEWAGLLLAFAGLVVLLLPGLASPPPLPAALMIAAGLAWGGYTWLGAGASRPLAETAGHFLRASPLALLPLAWPAAWSGMSAEGVWLALASGAIASGLAYAAWYAAVPALGPTRAAVLQLAVPVIAALAGVVLLGERLTPRGSVAGLTVLAGIGLALAARGRATAPRSSAD